MSDLENLPDLYDVLHVTADATEKQLQKAFRREAVKCHPDKNPTPEAAEHFHLLTIAIDRLINNTTRIEYDRHRSQKREVEVRKQKRDSARKAWIDELERNEAVARRPTDSKRKWKHDLSKEEQLAHDGARLRAELLARRKISAESKLPKSELRVEMHQSTVGVTRRRELHALNTTVAIRYRGTCTTGEDLNAIFETYGTVVEVILKPSARKTNTALLQFANVEAARQAAMASPDTLSTPQTEIREINLVQNENSTIEQIRNMPHKYQHEVPKGDDFLNDEERTRPITNTFESIVLSKMRNHQKGKLHISHNV